jgi:hypothetical protein
LHTSPGLSEDIASADLVIQQGEPPAGIVRGSTGERPLEFAGGGQSLGRWGLGRLALGLSRPSRGQSSSLSLRRTRDERSGPSLLSVVPRFTGTMTTSDSLDSVGPALAGDTLIRFPTGPPLGGQIVQGLSGERDVLSVRATVLDTVPAGQSRACSPLVRGRLRRQGSGSPREKLQLRRSIRWWG